MNSPTKPAHTADEGQSGDSVAADPFESVLRHAVRDGVPGHSPLTAGQRLLDGRFVVVSRLGSGGMGTVYRAADTQLGTEVALKMLHLSGAPGVSAIKREFRALANVLHPNLIDLHELYCDDSSRVPLWFFTMPLVEGETWLGHLWSHAGDTLPEGTRCDIGKLKAALPQLVSAVHALHAAGKLHRDVKPSNILVDRSGRVVVLDFGVARDLQAHALDREAQAGTPVYMAPEVLMGGPASPASDWYAVGAVLFESLTGRLPRAGASAAPGAHVSGVPAEIDALCSELLRIQPSERPTGLQIAQRLHASLELPVVERHGSFVGRLPERQGLWRLFEELQPGQPTLAHLTGPSGMGKTALAHEFANEVAAREASLVLRSRCYERETVPFKAVDGLVDQLSELLLRSSNDWAETLPRDFEYAARLFPVLGGLAPRRASAALDEQEPRWLRERGFEALSALLEIAAAGKPILLLIDDVQWADAGSARLLATLLSRSTAARLLLLVTHRQTHGTQTDFLETLDGQLKALQVPVRRERMELSPLTQSESAALAESMLGGHTPERVQRLVQEANGLPIFLCELARRAGEGDSSSSPSIDQVLEERIAQLQPPARLLLEVLAVASRPLDQALALKAAGVPFEGRAAVRALSLGRLAAPSLGPQATLLETYHDRIRERVLERLPALRLRELHLSLAETLQATAGVEPEWLFTHYLGAGRQSEARTFALAAAEQAGRALAFERAAALYKQALELGPGAANDWTIAEKLGNALANAGRDSEAGEAFERAVNGLNAGGDAQPEMLLDLRARAAEQYLQGAQCDKGLEVIRAVVREHGIAYPRSNAWGIFAILKTRTQLLARGLSFQPAAESNPATEARLERLWIAAKSLAFVSTIPTTLFSGMLTLEAFAAGHAGYLARGLSLVAAQDTMVEVDFLYRRADRVSALVKRLAEESGSKYELGFYHLSTAATHWFRGRFQGAVEHSERASALFAGVGRRSSYELAVCNLWGIHSLAMTGDLSRLASKIASVRKDAQERGDLFSERTVALGQGALARLAAGEAELALERAEALMQPPPPEFVIHCYHLLVTRVQTSWYLGRPDEAWRFLVQDWPGVKAAMLDQIACVRDELLQLRAHAALAVAATLGARDSVAGLGGRRFRRADLRKLASSDAARIARHRLPQCSAFSELISASVAQLDGDTERAGQLLRSAATGFDAAGMALYREACNLCLLRLGAAPELPASPLQWFAQHRVVAPEHLAAALAPALMLASARSDNARFDTRARPQPNAAAPRPA